MDYQKYLENFNKSDRFSMENGIRLTALSKGRAEAELSAGAAHTNFMGTVHGGALYTLCDVAGGCALIERGLCVTLDAAMTYLRPVKAGKVRAAAERIKAGGHIGVSRVEVFDEAGELCCTAQITMYMTGQPLPEQTERAHDRACKTPESAEG